MGNDSCENCWWNWNIDYVGCHFPGDGEYNYEIDHGPCGYFKAKVEPVIIDWYEAYQREWN